MIWLVKGKTRLKDEGISKYFSLSSSAIEKNKQNLLRHHVDYICDGVLQRRMFFEQTNPTCIIYHAETDIE